MNRGALLLGFVLLASYVAADTKVLHKEEKSLQSAPRAGYVTIGGKEYYVDEVVRRSWSQADSFCRALGMRIVTLEDKNKDDLIYGYLTEKALNTGEFWTGGTRVVGTWTWVSLGMQFNYENWARDEPNSEAVEVCAHTTEHGWADDDCRVIRHYICQH